MQFCDIRITRKALDIGPFPFSATEGAVVDFFGVVRAMENNSTIEGIEYEAFEVMAQRQLEVIADEARNRFGLVSVILYHRIGFVPVGEASLFVRVTARHRHAAFEGSSFIIERLKSAVPIWKHPLYANNQIA